MKGKNSIQELEYIYSRGNVFFRWFEWRRLHAALRLARLADGMDVLDVGCGHGELEEIMPVKNYGSVIATDIDPASVCSTNGKNAQLNRVRFMCGDISIMQFNKKFHVIFALDSLEHIKNPIPAIMNIIDHMLPGGVFVLCLPTENIIYKIMRFFLKGTFSSVTGPSSPHWHTAKQIHAMLEKTKLLCVKRKNQRFFFTVCIISVYVKAA